MSTDSETLVISLTELQQYLRPPGDSGIFQQELDAALLRMEQVAIVEQTVKRVIIEITP